MSYGQNIFYSGHVFSTIRTVFVIFSCRDLTTVYGMNNNRVCGLCFLRRDRDVSVVLSIFSV